MDTNNILDIILMGEGYQAEFKRSLPSKLKEISEEVCAFANAAGGVLLIGVTDGNQVEGIEVDNRILSRRQACLNPHFLQMKPSPCCCTGL